MEHKSIILYFIIKKKKREYFVTVAWIWDEHIKVSYFCFNSFEFHLNLKRYYDLHMMKISIDILLTQYLLCRYTYFKNIMSSFLSI